MLKIISTLSCLLVTALARQTNIETGTFNRIEAGSNVEVVVIQDGTSQIQCFHNGQPIATDGMVSVENGTLKLSANGKTRVRTEVHLSQITEIKLQKFALLSIQKLEQDSPLEIDLGEKVVFSGSLKIPSVIIYAGNGSVVNATVNAQDFTAVLGKDCRARFAGNIKYANLTAKANSTVNAIAMRTERAEIVTEANANVRSNVSGEITVQLDPQSRLTSSGKKVNPKPELQPEAHVVFAN